MFRNCWSWSILSTSLKIYFACSSSIFLGTCFDLSVVFSKFSNILQLSMPVQILLDLESLLIYMKHRIFWQLWNSCNNIFVHLLSLENHDSFCSFDCQQHARIWITIMYLFGFRVNSKLACEDLTFCCEPKLKPGIKLFICVLESTPAMKYAGLHSIAVACY